jgi:hypothetical protein
MSGITTDVKATAQRAVVSQANGDFLRVATRTRKPVLPTGAIAASHSPSNPGIGSRVHAILVSQHAMPRLAPEEARGMTVKVRRLLAEVFLSEANIDGVVRQVLRR